MPSGTSINFESTTPSTAIRLASGSPRWLVAYVVWVGAMMILATVSGILHDYYAYSLQWANIVAGGDPWLEPGIPKNTYGPLHASFAPGTNLSPLFSKWVFGLVLIAVLFTLLLRLLQNSPLRATTVAAFTLLVPANGFLIGVAFVFGLNDALVAAFIGLAVLVRWRKCLLLAGAALGLAFLLKFYPLLLLPVFSLDG